ncbi:ATP-binding domain-containing protein [Streptomyces sp. N2-109]|uniref:ATP-binding domain-containing protein n=1 Tax=Streptomyces gossypii TaxID=2883101 RepID=A0ABT2JLI5_9ACTN|nr:helix-hairpin-helix domain-containing protein [Streptomyces gossypii]MCT2588737.1 ATP-binding domain-containing protein [Streptomyces gossypii]
MTSQDKAAELLAAVRAVESGERPAASFFTGPAPGRAPHAAPSTASRGAGVPPASGGTDAAAAPLVVPEGLRALLARGGAPEGLEVQAVAALGERADEVLAADPWQLLAVRGVLPEQADGFARALLQGACGPDDERRTRALAAWLLERAALSGHTAMEPGTLTEGLARYGVPDPGEALRVAADTGEMLVFEDALEELSAPGRGAAPGGAAAGGAAPGGAAAAEEEEARPVRLLVGLDRYALAEESTADGLARLISTFSGPVEGAPGAPEEWERAASSAGSSSAAELLRAVAGHGLVTHTGGEAARAEPAALVAAARSLGLRAYAAVHSAGGRQRVAELITEAARSFPGVDSAPADAGAVGDGGPEDGGPEDGAAAVTLSGLLSGQEGPGTGEDGARALDLLVVLDAPQLGAEEAAALVETVPDGARLVLSGDPLLLGGAGPGQVFADVLAARVCPQVASRTPDPGPLGELVSGIGIGELNQVAAPDREVVIVPVREAAEAVHRAVQLVADSVPRAIGIPSESTQVIVPGHGGDAGTRALNAALKERLHPGPGRFGGFDPGDRVVHSPAPGRAAVGTVVDGEADGLRLECAGGSVLVPRDQVAGSVRHGWAMTAHQATGMRWPAAVVVLPGDAAAALTREWVYTAFGRAEQHLSVVQGADEALPRAVAGITAPVRTTRLRTLLSAAVRAVTAPVRTD